MESVSTRASNSEVVQADAQAVDILIEHINTKSFTLPARWKNEDYHYVSRPIYEAVKRLFDTIFSSLALVILAPFLLIIAAVVFIDDPKSSPFFVSKRCGKKGKVFSFYKFRTMCSNAEEKLASVLSLNEMDGPVFKIKNDPRITRIGKTLRRYAIDELPQLVNVIKGDMSIVGPRPPLPREVALYDDYHIIRLDIKPGLTCYWQTTPYRNSISFSKWVELDLRYIRERSLWVDIKLVLKTINVLVRGNGI